MNVVVMFVLYPAWCAQRYFLLNGLEKIVFQSLISNNLLPKPSWVLKIKHTSLTEKGLKIAVRENLSELNAKRIYAAKLFCCAMDC